MTDDSSENRFSEAPQTFYSIEKVDFGRIDAESDKKLKDYFVDTGVLKRVSHGDRQFIIGRKGSGKTALYQQAEIALGDTNVVPLEFSDYAWEKHKAIKELGLPSENSYTASWLFTFLLAMCNKWREASDALISEPATKVYKAIYGEEHTGLLDLLVDKLRRIRKLNLPNASGVGDLGGFELDELQEGPKLARAANVWNQKLLELATTLYSSFPVTVLVDRLDDGWDASEEMKDMLAGAIKAARALNLKFSPAGQPRPVVLFLRSDIFAELRFNDKNKIAGDVEYLEWDDDSLLDVVKERIAKSLHLSRQDAWDVAFSPEQMRQRAFISSYLLKRTMQRPRDIIAFCNFCRDAALKEGHSRIETKDIYEGEKEYSRHIYNELVDEMHKQVDDHAVLFKALRMLGYTRFRLSDWAVTFKKLSLGASNIEVEQKLKLLFDYGVVGVPKIGGKGGGTSFEFAYQDRYLDPRFDGDLVVHPALRKQLDLRDARAGPVNVEGAPDSGVFDDEETLPNDGGS